MRWLTFSSLLLMITCIFSSSQYDAKIIIVTTFDGGITALDAKTKDRLWELPSDGENAVSSSLNEVMFTNEHGQKYRLLPGFDGTLYQSDGSTVKPIMVSAEQLISSSYRLNDAFVIVGSKSKHVQGLDALTGDIIYECSSESDCETQHSNLGADDSNGLLMIESVHYKIRAIDPLSGIEQWNFSSRNRNIHYFDHDSYINSEGYVPNTAITTDNDIKLANQNSLQIYDTKSGEESVSFESPVISAWKLDKGRISAINLLPFGDTQTLLVNIFENQAYVMVSQNFKRYFNSLTAANSMQSLSEDEDQPFKMIEMSKSDSCDKHTSSALVPFIDHGSAVFVNAQPPRIPQVLWNSGLDSGSTSLPLPRLESRRWSILKAAFSFFIGGAFVFMGFYTGWIFKYVPATFLPASGTQSVSFSSHDSQRDVLHPSASNSSGRTTSTPGLAAPIGERDRPGSLMSHSTSKTSQNSVTLTSRYATDFEYSQMLGHGGFGVVIKAKNKMDEVEYAIKRLRVVDTPNQRERARREVRSWAQFDHVNVVRFYQAWFEFSSPDVDGDFEAPLSESSWSAEDESRFLRIPSLSSVHSSKLIFSKTLDPPSFGSEGHSSFTNVNNNSLGVHFLCGSEDGSNSSCDDNDDEDDGEESTSKKLASGDGQASKDNKPADKDEKAILSLIDGPVFLFIQMQLCQMTLREWLDRDLPDDADLRTSLCDAATAKSSLCICRGRPVNSDVAKMTDVYLDLVVQACCGLEHIHSFGICHRDLKPSNIFINVIPSYSDLDSSGNPGRQHALLLRIGDFGLAAFETLKSPCTSTSPSEANMFHRSSSVNALTTDVGTSLYMAPEQRSDVSSSSSHLSPSRRYTHKIDIFAMGLVFYEIFESFRTNHERIARLQEACQAGPDGLGTVSQSFRSNFAEPSNLVSRMLAPDDPDLRPNSSEILKEPWLKQSLHEHLLNSQARPAALRRSRFDSSSGDAAPI